MSPSDEARIKQLHELVRRRFVAKSGFLLDFDQPLPTKEDIEERFPNYCGWFTPIENGAFFTGLYLYGLLDNETAMTLFESDIRALKDALLHLQDVAVTDGFIARGVADDGVSHYPFSSDDQIGPFLLGLWKYRGSRICTEQERTDIDGRIIRTVSAVKKLGYRYPTEIKGVLRCGCDGRHWREVAQRIFLPYICHEITGDGSWKNDYESALSEIPDNGVFDRLSVLRYGYAPYRVAEPYHTFWIFVSSHLMQCEIERKIGVSIGDALEEGIRHNGAIASEFLNAYEKAEGLGSKAFGDWREQRRFFDPAANNADPNRYAMTCGGNFEKIVPGRRPEHIYLADSLFSAWIAGKSGNPSIRLAAKEAIRTCIDSIEWEKTRLCYAFAAESALLALQSEDAQE